MNDTYEAGWAAATRHWRDKLTEALTPRRPDRMTLLPIVREVEAVEKEMQRADAPVDVRDQLIKRLLSGDWFAAVGTSVNSVYVNQWVPVWLNEFGQDERDFEREPEDMTPEEIELLTAIQRHSTRRDMKTGDQR